MPITFGTLSDGEVTPFTLTVTRTHNVTGANTNSFAVTSSSIGTAAADRTLIICVSGRGDLNAALGSSTSVTVGGVAATKRAERNVMSGNYPTNSAIYTLPYPTGTTATIVYDFANIRASAGLVVFAAYGMSSEIPTAISETTYTSGTETKNIDVLSGGQVVGIFTGYISEAIWGGITERYDGSSFGVASGGFLRAKTVPVTISNIIGGYAFCGGLAMAAFR